MTMRRRPDLISSTSNVQGVEATVYAFRARLGALNRANKSGSNRPGKERWQILKRYNKGGHQFIVAKSRNRT